VYANVLTGMMPRPNTVWPPTGLPMPGAPVQPSVPVAKPSVTQSVPAASSEYQYVFLATILVCALCICVHQIFVGDSITT